MAMKIGGKMGPAGPPAASQRSLRVVPRCIIAAASPAGIWIVRDLTSRPASSGIGPRAVTKASRQSSLTARGSASSSWGQQPGGRPGAGRNDLQGARAAAPAGGSFLRELHIQNFALISQQRVAFKPGLNVLTGESGAGKSVIVLALGQVLGAVASGDLVRPPASKAIVTGLFQLDKAGVQMVRGLLADAGLPGKAMPAADGHVASLEVRREVSVTEGVVKSRCLINGTTTSLRVLHLLGSVLVDFNGQGASNSLRNPTTQLEQLDRIAGTIPMAQAFGIQLQRYQQLQAKLKQLALLGDEETRGDLQRMADEVTGMGISDGEEKVLRAQMRHMQEHMACVERCSMIRQAISGDDGTGIMSALADIDRGLRENHRQEIYMDSSPDGKTQPLTGEPGNASGTELMEKAMEDLMHALDSLRALERTVDTYARSVEFDERDFEQVASRLSAISTMMQRYQCRDTASLLSVANEAYQQLEEWWELEGQQEDIEAEHAALGESLGLAAVNLSLARREAVAAFSAAVQFCLAELGMPETKFEVQMSWTPLGAYMTPASGCPLRVSEDLCRAAGLDGGVEYLATPSGLDKVAYLLAATSEVRALDSRKPPSLTEVLRPLGSVASGGEAARITLSMKAAPSFIREIIEAEGQEAAQTCPIMVMDELDTGVGGRLGTKVGQVMARMCQSGGVSPATASQILCVTHLPQVAAHAAHHLRVKRGSLAGEEQSTARAVTVVEVLDCTSSRLEELTAMMGVEDGRELARQMLQAAAQAARD